MSFVGYFKSDSGNAISSRMFSSSGMSHGMSRSIGDRGSARAVVATPDIEDGYRACWRCRADRRVFGQGVGLLLVEKAVQAVADFKPSRARRRACASSPEEGITRVSPWMTSPSSWSMWGRIYRAGNQRVPGVRGVVTRGPITYFLESKGIFVLSRLFFFFLIFAGQGPIISQSYRPVPRRRPTLLVELFSHRAFARSRTPPSRSRSQFSFPFSSIRCYVGTGALSRPSTRSFWSISRNPRTRRGSA